MQTFTITYRTGNNRHEWQRWTLTLQALTIRDAFNRAERIAARKDATLIGVFLSA